MATSKNRRKNGKAVKNDNVKRMLAMAKIDIKHLMLCSVVDRAELEGEFRMHPRTVIYNARTKRIGDATVLQKTAIHNERWKWDIQCGVICRNKQGEVYFTQETQLVCEQPSFLTGLNEAITDTLMDGFEAESLDDRLTMFWVACPVEQKSIPLEAALAPVWTYNVLANMLTFYEQEHKDHEVMHYRTETLAAFCEWFDHQEQYNVVADAIYLISFHFVATGIKMQKGELVEYRKRVLDAGINSKYIFEPYRYWQPKATVNDFVKHGKAVSVGMTGRQFNNFMQALATVPPCVECYVVQKTTGEVQGEIHYRLTREGVKHPNKEK